MIKKLKHTETIGNYVCQFDKMGRLVDIRDKETLERPTALFDQVQSRDYRIVPSIIANFKEKVHFKKTA